MKEVTDEQIIRDAVSLVEEGMAVTMRVKGRSMLPFILGGRESVVLTRPGTIRPGDVVLARIDGQRYVLHRVMEVSEERVVLMATAISGGGKSAGPKTCWPGPTRSWGRTERTGGSIRRKCSAGRAGGGGSCRSAAGSWRFTNGR